MQWRGEVWRRLAFFFRRGRAQRDLKEEMDEHVRMKAKDLADEGMPPNEALNAARREFGNSLLLRERSRDAWGFACFEMLLQDLRYGLRILQRSPGFTTAAVLTLAIGLAANTAIFSVIDGVLLKPLAYPHPGRLVAVQIFLPEFARKYPMIPVDAGSYTAWSQQAKSLAGIAAAEPRTVNLTGSGEPRRLSAAAVTPNMFTVLGVQPMLGRDFSMNSDRPTYGREAMLTYGFWRNQFNGDPKIIGRGITLNGGMETVVGVLPASFHFPNQYELSQFVGFGANMVQVFIPLLFDKGMITSANFNYAAIARLEPGVSVGQARAEMSAILHRVPSVVSEGMAAHARAIVMPLREMIVRQSALGLWVLLGAVLAVLLIISVNLASLALTRATAREHEGAIRSALGASPGRLLRQSLAEMLLLGLAGGALGLVLAHWALAALLAATPAGLPRLGDVHLSGAVLVFTLVISLLAGLLAGLLPAWRMASSQPQDALRASGARTGQARAGLRSRELLIGVETALSVVLLAAAGLLLASFVKLDNVPMGFSVEHVLSVNLRPSSAAYTKPPQRTEFFRRAVAAARALPGVESAATIDIPPLAGETEVSEVSAPGDTRPLAERPTANYRQITPDLFRLLRIPLVEGRELTWADAGKHDVIVSAATAKAAWPGRDPIGQTFHRGPDKDGPVYRVVGVVGDTRSFSLFKAPGPMVYQLYRGYGGLALLLRTRLPTSVLAPELRQAIWKIDPSIPVPRIRSMSEIVSDSLAPRRFETLLTTLFAAAALLLACLGIYGVVSYAVVQRTQEVGVRMALGASAGDVYRLILAQGLRPVAVGLAVGLAGALVLGRFLAGLLFQIRPNDPATLAAVAGVLGLAAVIACALPARRATRIAPSEALRAE
jgi:predicted permease